jgi:hypothetical protein
MAEQMGNRVSRFGTAHLFEGSIKILNLLDGMIYRLDEREVGVPVPSWGNVKIC